MDAKKPTARQDVDGKWMKKEATSQEASSPCPLVNVMKGGREGWGLRPETNRWRPGV